MRTKLMAAQEAGALVNRYVTASAAVAWVPGATVLLAAADYSMIAAVARCFGVKEYSAEEVAAAVASAKAAQLLAEALGWVPVAGWLVKGVVDAGVAKVLGEMAIRFMWQRSRLPHELRIVNVASNRTLDVQDWGRKNGSLVQQWSYGGGANQKWSFRHGEREGLVQVVSMHSWKSLDVPERADSGKQLQIWHDFQNTNQRFRLHRMEAGDYVIEAHDSGHVLRPEGRDDHADGAPVYARPSNRAGGTELWRVEGV